MKMAMLKENFCMEWLRINFSNAFDMLYWTGEAEGTYKLNIDDVVADSSDPASYRTAYTVTIQAKNNTDSTWSYDSFILYVYDADALKIMVDGKSADEITMSNIDEISKMSQDEILALKRDIYLKNIISVNYGEYAWTEVADQIEWSLSDKNVASLNFLCLHLLISVHTSSVLNPISGFSLPH